YFIVYQSTQNYVRSPDDPAWYYENDIYARWVDGETGLPVGDPIPIYLGEGDQTLPQVSYSPVSDKFLIVWWDTHAPDDFEPVAGETGQYGELASIVGGVLGKGDIKGAVYGTPGPCAAKEIYGEDSKEVELMRYVRDNVLSQTPEGKELIRLYYQWSPAMVEAMKVNEGFREEVKGMIDGVLLLIDN
ncbi:MAG: CFI-box-CTERM domain-containing protein, partial [Thermodesulfobacteriota bacterium]